ncbi:hypothetical protein FRB99_004415 [Tulasnella sp. 403]|nr:hypothetical protein FRB99_004415 [Tulasnella sp. 403]
MPLRVFTGDENGRIKAVNFELPRKGKGKVMIPASANVTTVTENPSAGAVQRMAVGKSSDERMLLGVSRASGSTAVYFIDPDKDELELQSEWKESRFKKSEDAFVGLAMSSSGVYTCTSRGILSLQPFSTSTPLRTTSLPTRLKDFQLSPSATHFAYGGDEVDLSVWDAERAFSAPIEISEEALKKKRKSRKDKVKLLHGEVWRARNVPHDFLDLRQPVHVTSLTFLRHGAVEDSHKIIVTGSLSGAVRLYDIRVQDRPVQDWATLCKDGGGVKHVQCGMHEHQVIVTDARCKVYAIDCRTGRPTYSYGDITGAVVSVAPLAREHFASVSLDRYIRLHSAPALLSTTTGNQTKRGTVVHKEYLKGTPTAVVWDGIDHISKAISEGKARRERERDDEREEVEDIWDNMQVLDDEPALDDISADASASSLSSESDSETDEEEKRPPKRKKTQKR